MKGTKIIIEVKGGIVQAVHANTDLEYIVVDFDSQAKESVIIGGINAPDTVMKAEDNFYEQVYKADSTDSEEKFIHKDLKKKGF